MNTTTVTQDAKVLNTRHPFKEGFGKGKEPNKITILFLHTPIRFGGVDRFITKLIEKLPKPHFEPLIMCRNPKLYRMVRNVLRLPFPFPGLKRTLNPIYLFLMISSLPLAAIKLVRVIKQHRVDLIHTHSWDSFLYSGIPAKVCNIPIIHHLHGPLRRRWNTYLFCKYIISPGAKLIIAVSQATRKSCITNLGFKPDKIRVIYNGINSIGNKKLRMPKRSPKLVIGTATRIDPYKGLHIFIDAAKGVLAQRTNVEFWIAGDVVANTYLCYKRSLLKKVYSWNLDGQIKFLGWQDNIEEIIRAMDIYVYCTLADGFPLSILEAMALGKPVVAFPTGGIPEMVIPGKTGFLIAPGDVEALSQTIVKLIDNPILRREMGRAGQKRVRKYFSYRKFLSEIEEAYRAALK